MNIKLPGDDRSMDELAEKNSVTFMIGDETKVIFRNFGKSPQSNLGLAMKSITRPNVSFEVQSETRGNREFYKAGRAKWIPIIIEFEHDEDNVVKGIIEQQMQNQMESKEQDISDHSRFDIEFEYRGNRWYIYGAYIDKMREDSEGIKLICPIRNALYDETEEKDDEKITY